MPVVHYNSGVFYAWIDGVLQTIPIGSGDSNLIHGLNSPLVIDELNDPFEPILFNQPSLDNVAYRNRINAFTGANSFSALIDLLSGQIKFPATQNASADANTLDDYEKNTWTPALVFSTPGDLNVVYSTQVGRYTKIGNTVRVSFTIITSTFTYTTASGVLQITGLPFVSFSLAGYNHFGGNIWGGIVLSAGYSQVSLRVISNSSIIDIVASGSSVVPAQVSAGHVLSGSTIEIRGTLVYESSS